MSVDAVVERIHEGGNLLANLGLLADIATWETSQEVWKAWQGGAPVEGVSTANMAIYRLVDGKPVFNLLGRDGNLFVDERFRQDAYTGIVQNEFFFPPEAMRQHVMAAITADASVQVPYSGLRIKTDNCDQNYGYVEVDGSNTDAERKLFAGVYSTENPGNGKRIYLLRENVVKAQLEHKKDDLVARACYFNNNQYFIADDRYINDYNCAVRGVRRVEVAEGDAPKTPGEPSQLVVPSYKDALNVVLGQPVRDERVAAALLGHANEFYQARVK